MFLRPQERKRLEVSVRREVVRLHATLHDAAAMLEDGGGSIKGLGSWDTAFSQASGCCTCKLCAARVPAKRVSCLWMRAAVVVCHCRCCWQQPGRCPAS